MATKTKQIGKLYYDTTYSLYDGGYYAEVWNVKGQTVYESPLRPTRKAAKADARQYMTRPPVTEEAR